MTVVWDRLDLIEPDGWRLDKGLTEVGSWFDGRDVTFQSERLMNGGFGDRTIGTWIFGTDLSDQPTPQATRPTSSVKKTMVQDLGPKKLSATAVNLTSTTAHLLPLVPSSAME